MTIISYKFGEYDFLSTANANAPEAFEASASVRPAEVIIPRRHGSIVQSNPYQGARAISLRGSLVAPEGGDVVSLLDMRNDFHEALIGAGRQKLQEFDDRYIYAICTRLGFSYPSGGAMLYLDWFAEFLADVPFWESTSLQSHSWVASGSAIKSPGGKAPSPPTFTATIFAGTLTLLVLERITPTSTKKLKWTGSQGAGSLIVDMEAMTIKDGAGVSKLSGLSATAGENAFWSLEKGTNSITVTMTGGITVNTKMEWRARWY